MVLSCRSCLFELKTAICQNLHGDWPRKIKMPCFMAVTSFVTISSGGTPKIVVYILVFFLTSTNFQLNKVGRNRSDVRAIGLKY